MSQKLAVVVTGGTGKQGGAVVKSLLERGHKVRAVTRNTESAKARELANAGVTLVRASFEDTAALTKALEGATSLFAMTTPFEVQAGVTPISWLAVLCEWQRDWARTEALGGLAEVLVQHGGGSGIAFDWEMQLLGSKAKAT
jgi:NAD(P)-dependent dehydrogenase (short-subunit alcohol dehydrogenase family)